MIDLSRDGRITDTAHDAILPHGGSLVRRLLEPDEAREIRAKALDLPRVELPPRILSDLDLIGIGALSPLTGFMTREELTSVLDLMRLPDGIVMSLPVVLPITPSLGRTLGPGSLLALGDEEGELHGLLEVRDAGPVDLDAIAARAFGTRDPAHPGVAATLGQPPWIAGGPVLLFGRPRTHPFAAQDLEPRDTRAAFRARGWRTIAAFQTRNPIHRAHEYIQKVALEIVDGLLIHPLVGETKRDDIPAGVRMRCYEVLLDHYYPRERVLLSVLPAAMRYAGPREAVFHAILRRNYGCTHFIVGRDHAGVGSYYGTYDAQELLRSFPSSEIGIAPLCFENSFFCTLCGNMATRKTCPHPAPAHLSLSGTKVREMLRAGDEPPPEFTRHEVAQVLMRIYADPASGI